ncbi:MAG: AAA-like domain-containing protein [Calothrix sp. MO_167.B12]|nr:AAA-like domain-containing protein [Calothrix sp. MO_167.B12]
MLQAVGDKVLPLPNRSPMNYQDFQILVNENQRIRASSEQGDISGELRLDMDRTKQTLRLIEHQVKDGELLKGLGYELYQALFPNEINARFQATIAGAQANNHSVRLRLIFESPELAAFPWEFLYNKQTNTFLGNNTQTVLSRYIDVPLQKRDIKAASLPLRVLLVISSPSNLATLDVAGEAKLIQEALGKHIQTGDVELDILRDATIHNINQKLRENNYNVFHFIGHGDFQDNKGYIALVDRDGKANFLDDERFANFFLGNNILGLVILNSCGGATVSSNQAFAGTAPNLVRRGIPAVIAMQYPIFDDTAKIFADEFYRTLALGYPVDAAMQTTRNAISMEVGLDRRDFATPVLYMRARDGIILSGLDAETKTLTYASGDNQEGEPLTPRNQAETGKQKRESLAPVEHGAGYQVKQTLNEIPEAEVDTNIYIERTPVEEKSYREILQPGALIRVKAPQKMGKTLLLEKLLDFGRQHGYRAAKLDLKLAENNILANLKTFLQWLCVDVTDSLELEPKLDKYWQDVYGLNKNCTRYFQKYLLRATEHPLILAIDNFERLFAYPEMFPQFCLLLRSWYESAKSGDRIGNLWKKLRLVVVHSTEQYPELDTNHSPFNVGVTIELPEFNLQQIEALAKWHRLDGVGEQGLSQLMVSLGGHPYLMQQAISHLKSQPDSIESLLQLAPTEQGIFGDHLRQQLWHLQHNPLLELGYKQVVNANEPIRLDTEVAFKLHSLGLVKLAGNNCVPSCDLYRQYFSERLV